MTLVDQPHDLDVLDATDARALTDRIKTALGVTWELVTDAYQRRAQTETEPDDDQPLDA